MQESAPDGAVGEVSAPKPLHIRRVFGLLQWVVLVALWIGAPLVRDRIDFALAYAALTTTVTWTVVGRWAVGLSPAAANRILAGLVWLLVAAAIPFSAFFVDDGGIPVTFCLSCSVAVGLSFRLAAILESWVLRSRWG